MYTTWLLHTQHLLFLSLNGPNKHSPCTFLPPHIWQRRDVSNKKTCWVFPPSHAKPMLMCFTPFSHSKTQQAWPQNIPKWSLAHHFSIFAQTSNHALQQFFHIGKHHTSSQTSYRIGLWPNFVGEAVEEREPEYATLELENFFHLEACPCHLFYFISSFRRIASFVGGISEAQTSSRGSGSSPLGKFLPTSPHPFLIYACHEQLEYVACSWFNMLIMIDCLDMGWLSCWNFLKQFVFLDFRAIFLHDWSIFLRFAWHDVVLLHEICVFALNFIRFCELWMKLYAWEDVVGVCMGLRL